MGFTLCSQLKNEPQTYGQAGRQTDGQTDKMWIWYLPLIEPQPPDGTDVHTE